MLTPGRIGRQCLQVLAEQCYRDIHLLVIEYAVGVVQDEQSRGPPSAQVGEQLRKGLARVCLGLGLADHQPLSPGKGGERLDAVRHRVPDIADPAVRAVFVQEGGQPTALAAPGHQKVVHLLAR